jgi:Rad3-related DNA helicase
MLCPFELALTLCGLADVVLMDMNYAFDPFAQIARLFQTRRDFTLLADEAHHLLDRVRESLSGTLDTKTLREYRALMGKALGRKHPYLRQINALRGALKALGGLPEQSALKPVEASDSSPASDFSPVGEPAFATEPSPVVESSPAAEPSLAAEAEAAARRTPRENTLAGPPPELVEAAQALLAATFELLGNRLPSAEARREGNRMIRILAPFLYAAYHFDERYAALLTCHGRERLLELYCLSPAETIAQVTRGLRGTVFFSATLSPLPAMRDLLGGGAEDACFSLPSPFPRENLAVIRKRVQTRYAHRAESAEEVARCIAEAAGAHAGRYIAYFPSYAYLSLVYEHLKELPLPPILVQESEMTDEARERFLAAFTGDDRPKLGLCVLGGLFSEGVDLPGEQLIGAMIVGVGLPTPTFRLRTLQAYYEARFGDGFLYAWMIPAMQKVSQAGGRVIRTETDRGLVLLMDDRYFDPRYARLLPEHWALREGGVTEAARALWGGEGNA